MTTWNMRNRNEKDLANLEEDREQREVVKQKQRGQMSHSHVEDGLLVSHHLPVSHRQGVVASFQVKVHKGQLYYLDRSSGSGKRQMLGCS